MSATDVVKARWDAPFEAELPDRTVLIPGVTEVLIGADEARASDHWKVIGKPKASELRDSAQEAGVDTAGVTAGELAHALTATPTEDA